ncbi:hypothetical protein ACF07T_32980 [Streptomyces sp. NPDC015184]|uniref:hypothetical protein n=1 Tax=Streptomyces sp. NPDC015184 TaxID=3364946 RepID=UPI0036FE9485
MNAPMTPDAALTRLRQYGERTSTWSTATYDSGTEQALHEIALTLAAELDRLSDDLTGANLSAWEEQQESARLRLALESARRGRRELRAQVSRLENSAVLAEEDYGRIVRGACLVESQLRARVAELEALTPAAIQTCRICGAGYDYGQPCSVCEFKKRMAAELPEDPHSPVSFAELAVGNRIRFVTADNGFGGMGEVWRTGTITRITAKTITVDCDENLLGDTAVLRDAEWSARAVHRAPAVVAVENPWERAVAGLNALVDADVIFHVEPDGHISAPFSDEHIEWDLRARRWVLTRDDEDGDA